MILAVTEAAQLGIEPTGVLGNGYLVPYWNSARGAYEAKFQAGYRGMIALARRSGEVTMIEARLRYEKDAFEMVLGTAPRIDHTPSTEKDRGPIVGAYMVGHVRGAPYPFVEYMTIDELDLIRQRSKAKDEGPWVTDTDMMYRKTVVRRGIRYLPISVFVERAIELDDEAERDADNPPPQAAAVIEPADPLLDRLEHAAVVSSAGPRGAEAEAGVSDDDGTIGGLPVDSEEGLPE